MLADESSAAPPTLDSLLREGARLADGGVAISADGRTGLSHRALGEFVESTGETLRQLGLGREDRVAVALPGGASAATALLAIAANCACAPLDPRGRIDAFEADLADFGACALVVEAGAATPAREAARRRGIAVVELESPAGAPAGIFELHGVRRTTATSRSAVPSDLALLLRTSGTTARPKLVPLTHANLCASAMNVAAALRLVPADVGLVVMPLFHIHGIVAGLLAPVATGSCAHCTPGFAAAEFFGWLDTSQATWYSAVPTMHAAVVSRAPAAREAVARSRLRFVRSSSSPLPPATLAALEALFDAPVIEAYGMTEAAHQVASNPLPPGRRRPGSVGPPAGPDVAIVDAGGRHLARGETGEVVIRGPNVTSGYLDAPTENAASFADGWFRTGDEGYFDDDGYLVLSGRLKEMINRGGEKVVPREIDDALAAHPAVAQALAFAVPHPTLGEDVAAAVVLKPGSPANEPELRAFLFERLADFKVPSEIRIGDAITGSASGKPSRLGIAETLQAQRVRPPVAPADATETALASMAAAILGRDKVGANDNFFALGGDSLKGMELVMQVQAMFGVDLGTAAIFRYPSVRELAAALRARGGSA